MARPISVRNLTAALSLANAGLRIFPAHPERKAIGGWSKPPYICDWQSRATTDPIQIGCWWTQFPEAVPAIPCDDIIVLDADRHAGGSDGVAALTCLIKEHGDWRIDGRQPDVIPRLPSWLEQLIRADKIDPHRNQNAAASS